MGRETGREMSNTDRAVLRRLGDGEAVGEEAAQAALLQAAAYRALLGLEEGREPPEGEPLQVLVCVGRVTRGLEDGRVMVCVEGGPGPWAGQTLSAEADRDYPFGQLVALEVATRVVTTEGEGGPGTERRHLTPVRARVTVDVDVEEGWIHAGPEVAVDGEEVGRGMAGMLAALPRMLGADEAVFKDAVAAAIERDPEARRRLRELMDRVDLPPALSFPEPPRDEGDLTPEDFAGLPSAVSAPVLLLAMRHAHIEGWRQGRDQMNIEPCEGWMPLRSWTRFAEQNPSAVEAPTDGWWYCSFAEEAGWLGAVVAYGAGDARMLQTLASVGLNPGGQAEMHAVPREPPEEVRGRVLTAEEVGAWRAAEDREGMGL